MIYFWVHMFPPAFTLNQWFSINVGCHLVQMMGSNHLVGPAVPGPGIILWLQSRISSGYELRLKSGLCCTNEKELNGGQRKGHIFTSKYVCLCMYVCMLVHLLKKKKGSFLLAE